MKNLALFVVLFFSIQLNAQDWFTADMIGSYHQGYVVTAEGDTINGSIMYSMPAFMARKVIFMKDGDVMKKQKYKGEDLRGYYFMDAYWESHEFNDGSLKLASSQSEKLFLRPVTKGKLDVYEYYVAEITDWAKYEDGVNKILPQEMKTEVMLRKEGEDFVKLNDIRFMQFKKGMSKYLSDCESVAKDIEDKKLKRVDIWEIFDRYNQCQ